MSNNEQGFTPREAVELFHQYQAAQPRRDRCYTPQEAAEALSNTRFQVPVQVVNTMLGHEIPYFTLNDGSKRIERRHLLDFFASDSKFRRVKELKQELQL